ncbi:MAG: sigma-70 family RNA polymerase sigma factor [Phycisphaerae bacterium]|nr:sigma-70 family RNA polymerase sigma factor [Phycisphaerae bacterium]
MSELEEQVARAKAGELGAYGEIVRRFQDMAFGYACSILGDFHLAEDAAQDAFVEAYRRLGQLTVPQAFPGWFRRVVFSRCAATLRRRRELTADGNEVDAIGDAADGPAETAERREMQAAVLEAIRSLPEIQRTAATLFYINGYSQKQLAEFLEVPVTTVQKRIHDARRNLKGRLLKMVEDTLKENSPQRDEASDRVRFMLGHAERIGQGVPILAGLEAARDQMTTQKMRNHAQEVIDDVLAGRSIRESLVKRRWLLPPMVLLLIQAGEYLGELDVLMRMAGHCLREGHYEADPDAFTRAKDYLLRRVLKQGLAKGAQAVVMDSRRVSPMPDLKERYDKIWIELLMPDGSRERVEPLCPPDHFNKCSAGIKMDTILDRQQEGDQLTGMFRLRLDPADSTEQLFPITFQPFRDGEEIRICFQPIETEHSS